MNIQQKLFDMGFITESMGGGLQAMIWRGKTHIWVATSCDGGELPESDSWLVCEYLNSDWDEGLEDQRAFDSENNYFSDVVASMLESEA